MTHLDDREIIALFYARSEQAIEELKKKHWAAVGRVAFNILNDPQDAEECVNDTYLGARNTIPPQNPEPLRTYVCKIARNLALKKLQSNQAVKRNSSYDAALDELADCLPSVETVESILDAKELSAAVNRFLDAVSYDDRYIFLRRYWYADTVTSIAAMMHWGAHRVSVHLSRTRKQLRNYLKKERML